MPAPLDKFIGTKLIKRGNCVVCYWGNACFVQETIPERKMA